MKLWLLPVTVVLALCAAAAMAADSGSAAPADNSTNGKTLSSKAGKPIGTRYNRLVRRSKTTSASLTSGKGKKGLSSGLTSGKSGSLSASSTTGRSKSSLFSSKKRPRYLSRYSSRFGKFAKANKPPAKTTAGNAKAKTTAATPAPTNTTDVKP